MNENRIQLMMKKLDITREEALQLIEDDEKIDKGEKLFELTDEQKKASKKARMSGKTTVGQTTKREKKVDNDKRALMQLLINLATENGTNVNVLNEERELEFIYNERKFKIVLSAPRK